MIEVVLQALFCMVIVVALAALFGDTLGRIAFGTCRIVHVKREEDE